MREKAPKWVKDVHNALPDDMTEDHVAATLLMIIANYINDPSRSVPLMLSLPLTYFRASGMDLVILRKAYQAAADGVEAIIQREASERRH